jgi:DNA-binding PadR family transcriptional regulator
MAAPIFAHGQMRLYLLTLLAESPMHGYELMQEIERRFDGTYVPSAGTIYPRLAKLAEEGLITKETVGRKTVYAITDAGRAELEARRSDTDRLEDDIDSSVHRLADRLRSDVRSSMSSIKDDLDFATSAAGDYHASQWSDAGGAGGRDDWRGPQSGNRFSAGAGDRAGAGAGDRAGAGAGGRAGDRGTGATDRKTRRRPIDDAERTIYQFGLNMRDTLRAADAAGSLTSDTVQALGDDLGRVTDHIRALISRSGL